MRRRKVIIKEKKLRLLLGVTYDIHAASKKKQKFIVASSSLVKESTIPADPISNGTLVTTYTLLSPDAMAPAARPDKQRVEAAPEAEKGLESADPVQTVLTPTTDPPQKSLTKAPRRPKQQKPRAMNVSELRRQQEIMDVLLTNDGIMQLNTEMAIYLREHVQELAENGIQTGQSAGLLSDKKTIVRAVAALEERGQIKVVKTVILDPNRRGSLQQPTTIIYHPDTSQEKIQAFMATLQKP